MKRHRIPNVIGRSGQRNRLLASLILTSTLVLTMRATASAHGEVGNHIFLSPIVGNDAFPDNAISLTARRSDYAFSLLPELEKQLSTTSSVLLTGGWVRISHSARQDESESATDLSIYFRQAAYKSAAHELQFTVSPFLVLPTGNRRIADQGYTHLGGEALLGKGMGDLAEAPSLRYVRPLAVQAEAGYAGRIQGPANSDIFANLEFEYSLNYLDRFVQHVGLERPWVKLVPYVQFNYAQSFIASHLTTKPDFRVIPGLAYMGDYCELSVGGQFALNRAAASGDRIAVLGLVEVFYDELIPVLRWNPL